MRRKMLQMLGLALLTLCAIGFLKYRQIRAGMAMGARFAPPPTAVPTYRVTSSPWQPALSSVGSLRALQGVLVSTDLPGIVSTIHFESGTEVKQGDLLLQLDSTEQEAQLRSSEARLDLARSELQRKQELLAKRAISPAEFDAAQADLRQSEAAVSETRALIARKKILAPFQGILGIREVNLGQYVTPGTPVVRLESLDPILIDFALPQHHFQQLQKGAPIRVTAEGAGSDLFEGTLSAVDARVDPTTRNIRLQGTLPNPARKLRPGMFARVEVLLPVQETILSLPASAISYAPYGNSVFVVTESTGPDGQPEKTVEQQFVRTGERRGDMVAILHGVKEGDEVVATGVFKLRNHAKVRVDNSLLPSAQTAPKPKNS
jgi:membrane fusion protein (multidrug efflux system)